MTANGSQGFDNAKCNAASAVHGHAAGLVEHEQTVVLMEYMVLDPGKFFGVHFRRSGSSHSNRRDTDHIPGDKPVVRLYATLVYPDLPAANEAINAGFRDSLQPAGKKVVEALTRVRLLHRKQSYLGDGLGARFQHGSAGKS